MGLSSAMEEIEECSRDIRLGFWWRYFNLDVADFKTLYKPTIPPLPNARLNISCNIDARDEAINEIF